MRASNVNNMMVLVNKDEALSTLKENRIRHSKIVQEAREGYVKTAKVELARRLNDLESGSVVSLNFALQPPQNYTNVYDVAIKMLELHTKDTIELDGRQVQHMIMDNWDWQNSFLLSSSLYSSTAVSYASDMDVEVGSPFRNFNNE